MKDGLGRYNHHQLKMIAPLEAAESDLILDTTERERRGHNDPDFTSPTARKKEKIEAAGASRSTRWWLARTIVLTPTLLHVFK